MILNVLLYFANKGSLKTFISSCKSHNQCKPPEATQLKKTIAKLWFLHMPKLNRLIFCIWIRMLQSVRPVNGFMVSFSSLQHISYKKTTHLAVNGLNFWRSLERGGGWGCLIRKGKLNTHLYIFNTHLYIYDFIYIQFLTCGLCVA